MSSARSEASADDVPDGLRRFSSSRRDLQRNSLSRRPATLDDHTVQTVLERRRGISRRVTPARQARPVLKVPTSVVQGMRLVDELLGECFEDIDGDATCSVCCTPCMGQAPAKAHRFSFAEVLAALLVNGPAGTLVCQQGHPVRISELVPDYCLTDIDSDVPLLADQNSVVADGKKTEIGRGAFGTIFRAVLSAGVRGTPVGATLAIKELIVAPDATVTQRVQVLLEFRTELLAMQRAGRNDCLVGALALSTRSPSSWSSRSAARTTRCTRR